MAKKNKTVDFDKHKNKSIRRKLFRKLRIPTAIIMVLLIMIVSLAVAGEVRCSNIYDTFRAIPATTGKSPGYPFKESELYLNKVLILGDKPVVVTDSGVEVLSQDADILQQVQFDRKDTKVETCNGRALIYSNTSDKAYFISRTSVLAEYDEEGTLITATVAKNGTVAIACKSESSQGMVKVYTPKQDEEFVYSVSSDYISAMALSSNGKRIAISEVNVDNAKIRSKVLMFRTKNTKADFDITLDGSLVLKVVCLDKNRVAAVCDNKTVIIESNGKISKTIEYTEGSLCFTDTDSDGNLLLVYKEFGGTKVKSVTISPKAKTKEFEIPYTPDDMDIRGNKIAASLDNTVTVYSTSGDEKDKIECESKVSSVLISTNNIFTLENGMICKY